MVTVRITRRFLWFKRTRTVMVTVPANRRTAEEQARYDNYHASNAWGR